MKLHDACLFRSENHLRAAVKLSQNPDPVYDASIVHAHRCAEMALRGYLSFREQDPPPSPELIALMTLCIGEHPSFRELRNDAVILDPCGSFYSSPETVLVPEPYDVIEAIDSAQRILLHVKAQIRVELQT
mgnify:CR=1 FL=1